MSVFCSLYAMKPWNKYICYIFYLCYSWLIIRPSYVIVQYLFKPWSKLLAKVPAKILIYIWWSKKLNVLAWLFFSNSENSHISKYLMISYIAQFHATFHMWNKYHLQYTYCFDFCRLISACTRTNFRWTVPNSEYSVPISGKKVPAKMLIFKINSVYIWWSKLDDSWRIESAFRI